MSDIPLFTFGKYRNRPIDELVTEDPSYVMWAFGTVAHSGITAGQYTRARHNLGVRQRRLMAVPEDWGWNSDEREVTLDERPKPVYYSDGSGYLPASGPCGPLYFDRNGET